MCPCWISHESIKYKSLWLTITDILQTLRPSGFCSCQIINAISQNPASRSVTMAGNLLFSSLHMKKLSVKENGLCQMIASCMYCILSDIKYKHTGTRPQTSCTPSDTFPQCSVMRENYSCCYMKPRGIRSWTELNVMKKTNKQKKPGHTYQETWISNVSVHTTVELFHFILKLNSNTRLCFFNSNSGIW